MPYTDAYGRTISDDGRQVWDGHGWQPLTVPAPPAGYAPVHARRSIWGIVAVVVVISVVGVVALGVLGFYALVRQPSYGNGYSKSYQQQRAVDESMIQNDLAACRTSPSGCNRTKLRTDIRFERNQVSGLKSFPFTPPCLVGEMNSELSLLNAMYAAAATPAGDSTVSADLDQLAALRNSNPCP